MSFVYSLVLGFLPSVLLFILISYLDRRRPEPISMRVDAFFYGGASAFAVVALSLLMRLIPGYADFEVDPFFYSFCQITIPEEGFKLLFLWLVLRKNRFYDEKFDGIVYACCVAIGFAAYENVLYILGNGPIVAIPRAILAVPGHFLDGVLMGYFYALATFNRRRRVLHAILAFVAPVISHGIYDYLLLKGLEVSIGLGILLFFLFLGFVALTWFVGLNLIIHQRKRDDEDEMRAKEEARLLAMDSVMVTDEVVESQEASPTQQDVASESDAPRVDDMSRADATDDIRKM